MLALQPEKPKATKPPAMAKGFSPQAVAQVLNQQPDSIPAMVKPGEYVLPPDTVAAMGGAGALDAVVGQTHVPGNQAAKVPKGFEPKMFFAGGGRVEDEKEASPATTPSMKPSPSSPSNTFPGNRLPGDSGSTSAVADPAKTPSQSAAQPPGGELPEWSRDQMSYGDQMRNLGSALLNVPKHIVSAPGYGFNQDKPAAVGAKTVDAPAAATSNAPSTFNASTAVDPTYGLAPIQKPAPAPAPAPSGREVTTGVYEHGLGQYSDSPDGMGFKPGFTGQPNARNMAAADALASRGAKSAFAQRPKAAGPGSGPVEPGSFTGGFSGSIGQSSGYGNMWSRTPEQQRRDAEVQASSIHKQTAARGNTALAALNGQELERMRGENASELAGINNEAALQRTAMQEAGLNQRSANQQATDAQRFALDAKAKGFDIRNAQRKEGVLQRYDTAKNDEERAALVKRYPDVFGMGKEQGRKLEVVRGSVDPMTGKREGDYALIFDPATSTVRQVGIGGSGQQGPVTVSSKEEMDKLSKGTQFVGPDGKTYTKN